MGESLQLATRRVNHHLYRLNDTNYTVWTMRMKVALKVHKAWETIDLDEEGEKSDMARALLFQPIPESLILQVGN